MSKRIVDTELLKSDIRSLTRVLGLKQRINNALKDADIYSRIERVFINQGYDYTIYKDEKTFSINVKAHNFCVTGKKEKTAELLELLVCEYLKDVKNIYVRPDEAGIIWMLKNIDGKTLVRVPIDFDNYQSQCDALLNMVNNEEFWTIEHKDNKVQVLKSQYSYGNKLEWINIATNEWYYNLKL